ncbi:MAG TPA: ATP-binding protein [Candidatus Baltobacteraceae bacterium]|nr:ATP-binding protein [Candidatus Baltobacteraceae bacterium]
MSWVYEAKKASSALGARGELMAYLRPRVTSSSDLDAAIAIFAELVGNVIRHAPGPIEATVSWEGYKAVLSVADCGTGFTLPTRFELPAEDSEDGRGLYIVSALAEELWDERPHQPYRHQINALLPVRKRSACESESFAYRNSTRSAFRSK